VARIAIGGFQHETNTFAPSKATYAMFEQGGGWPGVSYGNAIFDAVAGANIPVEGAIRALRQQNHQLVGTAWGAASPSAHVTTDAFERIVVGMLSAIDAAGKVDAIYLDLHGAMVTEAHDDGEGEILRRVRALVGARVPIVASLDLHSNTSADMMEYADALVAYRTYPHIDMAETGERAARVLMQMLKTGQRLHKAFKALDFLTSINAQSTFIEPGARLYRELAEIEDRHDCTLSFTPGFPMADIPMCGMAVFGMGVDAAKVTTAVNEFTARVAAAESEFHTELLSPDVAVQRAMKTGQIGRPTVVADTQDNPGAGGNGDTTGMLAALVRQQAPAACLGMLVCPESAKLAHEIGPGGKGLRWPASRRLKASSLLKN
jgi:microcystin degradation protein MlrC